MPSDAEEKNSVVRHRSARRTRHELPRWSIPALLAAVLLVWGGVPVLVFQLDDDVAPPAVVSAHEQRHSVALPSDARAVERCRPDGSVFARGHCVRRDGRELRIGAWQGFDSNGYQDAAGFFDEEGSGVWYRWLPGCELVSRHEYEHGRQVRQQLYFRNGRVSIDVEVDDEGRYHGRYRSFMADGRRHAEGRFERGRKQGRWLLHHRDGVTETRRYDQGLLIDDEGATVSTLVGDGVRLGIQPL